MENKKGGKPDLSPQDGEKIRQSAKKAAAMIAKALEQLEAEEHREENDLFGPVIFKYTAKDGVENGIFVEVGSEGEESVYFTSNLFESDGYQDNEKRIELVKRGLKLLEEYDPEDTEYIRLRVI